MARYHVCDANGVTINTVEWDGHSLFEPGDGCTLHLIEEKAVDPVIDLDGIRAGAVLDINMACEAARNRASPYLNYIDTEYQILAAQADAYVAAGMPENPVGLDMLVESAADSGLTIAQEAAVVRGKRDAYITLLNATRRLRRQGQAAIAAASDIETIHSVRDEYVAQLASL